jgi:hypothetical protein
MKTVDISKSQGDKNAYFGRMKLQEFPLHKLLNTFFIFIIERKLMCFIVNGVSHRQGSQTRRRPVHFMRPSAELILFIECGPIHN